MYDRYVKAETNTIKDGSELVEQSVDLTYPKIKTLTYHNFIVSTNSSSRPAELELAFTDVSGELVSNYNTETGIFTVPRTGNYLGSFSKRYAIYGDVYIDVRSNNTSLGKYTRSTNCGTRGNLMDFTFSLPFAFVQGTSVRLVIEAASSVGDSQANIANKEMLFSIVSVG